MRRQSQEAVAEAARRRLELLARELEQAGLRRIDPADGLGRPFLPPAEDDSDPAGPEALGVEIAPPGRHVRDRGPSRGERAAAWLAAQVPDTFRGRVGLSAGPALLVVLLVVVGLVATVVVVSGLGGSSESVSLTRGATGPAGRARGTPAVPVRSGSATPSSSSSAGSGAGATGTVTVDVAGKVRRPGLAVLPAGARVADALAQAGGVRGHVDLTALNLARKLVDGEQILVGRTAVPGGVAASMAASSSSSSSGTGSSGGALVDLNTATVDQLDSLPGVGPVTAQKIMAWRQAHGSFSSVDELLEVDGIGPKTLADIAPHVTV